MLPKPSVKKDEVYFTPLYYVMSHFSKFMRPGAVKIGCNINDKEASEINNLAETQPVVSEEDKIKNYLADLKSKLAKKNLDNMPTGDNCKGYPLLRHTVVGYDIKNS